jgi:hypothetical protein
MKQPANTNFKTSMKGQVIAPGNSGYDERRTTFYGGFDRKPAVIVLPADAEDVKQTIALALESGLPLAVRSGGHSPAGHSVCEGGIVLDLSSMKKLQIDAEARSAWVETGLTTGEYTVAADAYDLATPFGDTASVGIGGITLSGGVGYLVRKHGLTIDNLLAADVVTADGQLLRADHENHPDLFWALRGGGGNFGVATRFKFRLHQLSTIVGGMLFLPATPDVIAGFIGAAHAAPEELSAIVNVMPAPPMPFVPAELYGKLIIIAMMVYAGDVERGMQAVAPFRKLAQPLADMVRPMRYPEMYPPEDGSYHPTAIGHTMFLERVEQGEAKTILEYLQESDAPLRVIQLRVLGGAVQRVPNEATAFAHRQSRIMANVASFYTGAEDFPIRQAWVSKFASALQQGDSGAYTGFLGDEGEERVQAAYPGATWDRLRAIKKHYDPGNLFRLNQNIPVESNGE